MEETFNSFQEASRHYARQMDTLLETLDQASPDAGTEPSGQLFLKFLNPELFRNYLEQQQEVVKQLCAQPDLASQLWDDLSTEPHPERKSDAQNDKRFADPAWTNNPYLKLLRNSYLTFSENVLQLLEKARFPDASTERRVKFQCRQIVSALAPCNTVAGNPTVLREALRTSGRCLAKGMQNLMEDLNASPPGLLNIKQSATDAFELGKDLASTPGTVIYENKQMQLIQYEPQTKFVHRVPLLLVPPIVNKYYLLDFDKRRSLVHWLLSKGFQVFMISWVNPNENQSDIAFTDYVTKGIIQAISVCRTVTNSETVNTAGYCTGGTLLAIALALLKARGDSVGKCSSFLAAQTDFQDPGDLGVYLDKGLLRTLELHAHRSGVLDGRILATAFNLLRENELFWPYVIDQYFLGKRPNGVDILHWHSDSTNLSAATLTTCIEKLYRENALTRAGGFNIDGIDIDLANIEMPAYFLAFEKDHIVPWRATFRSSRYFAGKCRFVLGESGHVAGIINPAKGGKYGCRTNSRPTPDADCWLEGSEYTPHSWWRDWANWLKPHSGTKIAARPVGSPCHPALEPAPGRYVKVTI
jgi:polyhydroxyalkanoate synthase